jgi:hypothetical protein
MLCCCEENLSQPKTFEEIHVRCTNSIRIAKDFEEVASDYVKWMSVYKCRICMQFWAMEYPFGAKHGHGRKCYYQIKCSDPSKWLVTHKCIFSDNRRDKF